jgi:hypothetical protein
LGWEREGREREKYLVVSSLRVQNEREREREKVNMPTLEYKRSNIYTNTGTRKGNLHGLCVREKDEL